MKLPLRIIFTFCLLPFALHSQPATNLWSLQLASYPGDASPALAPDGMIYVGAFDGNFFAVTPDGKVKWTFNAGREIKSTAAIADDGTIYFGSRDRKFYALAPDGQLKWSFQTGAWNDSSPAIGDDGTIYFGSWDTNFYALNPNGSLKWKFPTGAIIDSSPAIGAGGTIYFGSHDKNFYALSPAGKLRWKFLTQGQIVSSPAIGDDGMIYFPSLDGNLYALNRDGSEKWRCKIGATFSSPVLDENENIYLSATNFEVAINHEGKKLWTFGAADWIDPSPAVASGGTVYFSQPWGSFLALDSRGQLRWLLVGQRIYGSPVIGNNGIVYFTSDRFLIALAPTNALPPAKSSWPMFRANPQRTGRVTLNR